MITGYEVQNVNNEKVLILYINYDSEFGMDFRLRHKNSSMKKEIKKFMKEKKIKFNGEKIALSFGGIILAVLLLVESPTTPDEFHLTYVGDHIIPNQVVEVLDFEEQEEVIVKNDEVQESIIESNNQISDVIQSEQESQSINQNFDSSNDTIKNSNNIINTTNNKESINENEEENTTISGKQVTVYRTNGQVITLSFQEYLIGVVGAEMPASFNIEALKAQAVVARTYALKKIGNGEKLTDSVSTQSYKDNNELKKDWGNSFDTYYQKIKKAVIETEGLAIYYQGDLIDAVYHSTSNGKTEDAIYVWGNDIPYLKSVDSSWDQDATSYLRETSKDFSNVLSLLGVDIRDGISVEILSRDASGRVLEVKVGDKKFSGVEFRKLLGLRSADFDLFLENGILTVTTRGYGHGVGMSQYGANGMAKLGYTYKQILNHYYINVSIY